MSYLLYCYGGINTSVMYLVKYQQYFLVRTAVDPISYFQGIP